MRRAALALAALLLAPPAAAAGEPSGLDPAVLDSCLAAAPDAAACAGKAAEACRNFWSERDPSRDAVTVRLACLDAEQQLWEARLTDIYQALLDRLQATRPDAAEPIREAERAWIAFRDARCRAEVALFGHGTGGIVAEPECKLAETARQVTLLGAWLDG